jgi:hypothetical protein
MQVIRHIQILVGVALIIFSIKNWIPSITILCGAVLWSVNGVCHLVHHQLMDRRINIWVVNGPAGLKILHRQDWMLVINLRVNGQV